MCWVSRYRFNNYSSSILSASTVLGRLNMFGGSGRVTRWGRRSWLNVCSGPIFGVDAVLMRERGRRGQQQRLRTRVCAIVPGTEQSDLVVVTFLHGHENGGVHARGLAVQLCCCAEPLDERQRSHLGHGIALHIHMPVNTRQQRLNSSDGGIRGKVWGRMDMEVLLPSVITDNLSVISVIEGPSGMSVNSGPTHVPSI